MTRRTAVITGGAGGLGRALTKALIDDGWFVAIIDLPGSEFQSALDAVDAPNLLGAFACDLTDREQVAATCRRICDERPSVDLVIYNAGVTQISQFSDLARETHERVMNINYFGAVDVASHFLQPLRQSRGTHLAISSVAGFAPLVKRTAYAASKHAMEGFFGSLRAEEARHNVRVCIAAPSFIGTNINRPGVIGNRRCRLHECRRCSAHHPQRSAQEEDAHSGGACGKARMADKPPFTQPLCPSHGQKHAGRKHWRIWQVETLSQGNSVRCNQNMNLSVTF